MSERKLYQVFKGLDEAEVRSFEAFLRDDQRAAGKRLWKFYASLRKNVLVKEQDEAEVKVAEEQVARMLEKNNEDLDLAFRRWCNKLLEKLHRFLIQQEIDAFPEEMRQLLLLRAYERRTINAPFPGLLNGFQRKISKMPHGDLYYELEFRASQIAIQVENPGGSRTKGYSRDIGNLYDNLDHKYLFHLARLNAFTLHHNHNNDVDLPTRHWDFMWELASGIDRAKHPGIGIYLSFIELLRGDINAETIFQFERKVREIYHRLEPSDRYLMYGYCLSKAQILLNQGNDEFIEPVLEMQIFGIENRLFFSEGKMDYKFYQNTIQLAITLGKVDLVRKLQREYAEDLLWYDHEGQKEAIHHLIEAKLYLLSGENEKAMSELNHLYQNYKLNDIGLEIDFRTLKLQLHYLLRQWQLGSSTLDAYRMYVTNNAELFNKDNHKLLSWRQRWFRRLYRMGSGTPKRIPKLLAELEKDPQYRLKPWFREQLEKMRKK